MNKTLPILAFLLVFLLAACSGATEAPPATLDQGQVDASVNATLTAMAPPPEEPTEEPTEAPTAQPPPTDTPVPTPTPTLVPIAGDPAALLGEPEGVDTFDSKGNIARRTGRSRYF
jgi:outer membrane biosynthesis protein TonB